MSNITKHEIEGRAFCHNCKKIVKIADLYGGLNCVNCGAMIATFQKRWDND